MSRVCQLTGKKSQRGKKITKVWGVKYRSIRHRQPNLVKSVVEIAGVKVRMKLSTRALKSIKNGKYAQIKMPDYGKKDEVEKRPS